MDVDLMTNESGLDIAKIPQIIIGEGWLEGVEQIQIIDIVNLVFNIITVILIIFFHDLNYTKKCRGKLVSRTKLIDGQTYVKTAQLSIDDTEKAQEMKPLQKNSVR